MGNPAKKEMKCGPKELRKIVPGMIQKRLWGWFRRNGLPYAEEGYPLQIGEKWLLLHATVDFHLDGFSIVRLDSIESIRKGNKKKGHQRILDAEGITDRIATGLQRDLSDIAAILNPLKERQEIVILDFEDYLYIGHIIKLGKKNLSFRCFNTNGRWEKKLSKIPYDTIEKIRFETEYGAVYEKHLIGGVP